MAGEHGAEHHAARVDVTTYNGMIGFLKWGAVGAGLLVALVIYLIAG
ncbi:hypothetical protein GCM10011380_14370 [Sphingomonas metalli]|uniref:Aa3-type cytochrome c oxidase subunit IV n=1 Tax=Sphingomonas metalli TaxID=1779358 RepID=A0A916T024_9SPHN|nr:hypothetical protein [Sphingomonas metalli]GGB25915.1 hypothetical protein GCM10011380_14370 [Sphingomonas metalli]